MNFRCILSGLIAAATLSLSAFASPARDGFGVRRNFYMSGRLSAKASDIAGVFEVNYIGRQPYRALRFYSSNENCTWGRFMVPQVIVDGKVLDEPYIKVTVNSIGGAFNFPITVPEGYYFVMGDNRRGSADSRFPEVGLIKKEQIYGKAVLRYSPIKDFKILLF